MPTDIPTPPNAPGPTEPAPPTADALPNTSQGSAPPAGQYKEANIGNAVAKANEKRKRRDKNTIYEGIPTDLAPRWELIVDEAAKRIKAKRDTIKIAIGEKPYRGIPVTEEDAEIRYQQMRDSAKLQTEALQENVTMSKAGRLLVNKDYLKALRKLEKKVREGDIQTTLEGEDIK